VITLIIDMVHNTDQMTSENYSDYISKKLDYDFKYLSRIFSDARGITIENYIIAHKIERAKELILYNELTLTQISYKLNYSSVAHLSNQFKKVTGLTPTYFKQMKHKKRISLEKIGVEQDD
jgi:AraC-like DNA-binding protein